MTVGSPPARIEPTTPSPVFTPTRICTATPSWGTRAVSVSCMRSAARTARSASSSCATGAPNWATSSSPTILSSRPPNAVTSATSSSKLSSTRRFTCSGSAAADRAVNPTRSAINTVTRRRSSGATTSRCPHSGQNRAPSGTGTPQAGQVMAPRYRPAGSVHPRLVVVHVQVGPPPAENRGRATRERQVSRQQRTTEGLDLEGTQLLDLLPHPAFVVAVDGDQSFHFAY